MRDIREYKKRYYLINKEIIKEKKKEYYYQRKEKIKNILKDYYNRIRNIRQQKIKEFINDRPLENILDIISKNPMFVVINKPVILTFD